MKRKIASIVVICALVLTAPASAGELSADLTSHVQNLADTSLVRVWIKLVPAANRADFSAIANDATLPPATRHRRAIETLQDQSRSAQASLLSALTAQSRGRARQPKGHWIANVIEAEVPVGELTALASRPDVELVTRFVTPTLIAPVSEADVRSPQRTAAGISTNLAYIKANLAWLLGYTGKGRLICSFDSGIEGTNAGLTNSWKGKDGDSAAAWFDPIDKQKAPHLISTVLSSSRSHGTHVMGIMVGRHPTTGDTLGVAPDAKWISAGVVDVDASILDAFEWAADPDGNPSTLDDMPDVINHSWGFQGFECLDIYYDAIDNTEALGIVNIFAVGNEGTSGPRNPAERALDSIDCFAVGNLNATVNPPVLSGSSSQGPSTCQPGEIKPNVVAPGATILSTIPTNTTGFMSGSSMAAPHVAGLVALMRQKNPNATPAQIKTAILASSSAAPGSNWGALPNNLYGWGQIDCVAALGALGSPANAPLMRVYDLLANPVGPGDTLTGSVVLQNTGALSATNVSLNVQSADPLLTVIDGIASFGNITALDTGKALDDIKVVVSESAIEGAVYPMTVVISGSNFTNVTTTLSILVGSKVTRDIYTHNTGRVQLSVSNFGGLGLGDNLGFPTGGAGFRFNSSGNQLLEGGLMIGTGFSQVSSAVHSASFEPERDFVPAAGGSLEVITTGSLTMTRSAFTDEGATVPIGIHVTQETFGQVAPNDDFITIRYIIRNTSGATINGMYVGLYLDWETPIITGSPVPNCGSYDAANHVAWTAENTGGTRSDFRGARVVEGNWATAWTVQGGEVWIPYWGGNGFTTDEKFGALTNGFVTATTQLNSATDIVQVVAAGPITLSANQIDTVSFAILAGNAQSDINSAAARAAAVPTDVNDPDEPVLPTTFTLFQNYPNPFNPNTTIAFDLPRAGEYTVSIYNVLGQSVFEETGRASAGRVLVDWDATGNSSGVYFYKVTSGEFAATKKMLLLK